MIEDDLHFAGDLWREIDITKLGPSWQDRYTTVLMSVVNSQTSYRSHYSDAFISLRRQDNELFEKRQLPVIVFSSLGLVHYVITHCIENGVSDHGFFHIIGHILHSANADAPPEYAPPVTALPSLFLADFKEHPQINAKVSAEAFVDYAYTGYVEPLKGLIQNSHDTRSWVRNIVNCLPYLEVCRILPTRELTFLGPEKYRKFEEHEKIMEEALANLFSVVVRLGADGLDSMMAHPRNAVKEIASTHGRVEALMALNILHRNRLTIPTFIHNEIKEAVQDERSGT
jgi:hypothetical protein